MIKSIKDIPAGAKGLLRRARAPLYRLSGGLRYSQRYYHERLKTCLAGSKVKSDISDHLGVLFSETVLTRPRLIVELGTRGGESTRALIAAASVNNAKMLSVDIDSAPPLDVPGSERWSFVQSDDVGFGRETDGFERWCADHGLAPEADVIFIDTSHLYEHTKEEIAVWHKRLSPAGVMLFHDTNMSTGLAGRLDGSVAYNGWNNQRGVIRAIEEFLGRSYDERTFFVDIARGFLVTHRPNCSGFTALRRLPDQADSSRL
jgi:predicted O-methyltransferase YrrM